ncbi:MAG TPA: TatD family hydrolase [Candidatus Limnocylindria bacterium]|nr:TatD family hydrolase [Candidatus Limnocylindria bacterium]
MSRRAIPERLPGIVDSHAHLQHGAFDADRDAVIERAREAGIVRILVPGWDVPSSEAALELAARHDGLVDAAVGVHPHHAADLDEAVASRLEALAADRRASAVGEIGLDHYRTLAPHDAQGAAFARQLEIAGRAGKPVLVHDRDAHAEVTAALLEWTGPPGRAVRGVLHSFSGDTAMARRLVEAGYLVSFALSVSFRGWQPARDAAAALPAQAILVETDAPYLGPGPDRRNEPPTVLRVAAELARYRATAAEEVAAGVAAAYRRLLGR